MEMQPEPETEALDLFELLVGREAAFKLAEFLHDERQAELLLPSATRRQRKRQHALLRSHFPTVFSESENQCIRIRRVVQIPVKCVAVDLDNTIWPGVLLEGLGDWHTPAGVPLYHMQLQHELLRLHDCGVLLVSCSRNDEVPVLAAWPPPNVCPLQPEHFVCHRFGWGAKSARLVDFCSTIGLAQQALVFVDDMPSERAEVHAAMPDSRVVGGDMTAAVEVLRVEADRIGVTQLTADAASRTEKTRAVLARAAAAMEHSVRTSSRSVGGEKTRRRAAKLAGAPERASGVGGGNQGGYPVSFLKTLDLKLSLRCCQCSGGPELRRAAELAARTTQFNTAAPQPQEKALALLEQLLADGGEVWTMSAVDRFGNHGVVGVLALQRVERRVMLVSISCRILALRPAAVFVSEVLRVSKAIDLNLRGTTTTAPAAVAVAPTLARAHLTLTTRNGPCRSLFSDLGFIQVDTFCTGNDVARGGVVLEHGLSSLSQAEEEGQNWELLDASRLPQTDPTVYCVTFDSDVELQSNRVVLTTTTR